MRIRDGKNSDPGWKKFGSGMENIRIRDKHSGSATLIKSQKACIPPQNISPEGFLHGPLWYLEGVDGLYEGGTAVPGGQGGRPPAPRHQVLPREAAARHKRQVRLAETRLKVYKICILERIRIHGYMPLTNGSGSCHFRH